MATTISSQTRMLDDLQTILVTEADIQKRITQLGAQITADYQDYGELTVIAVINGSIIFTADLIRAIAMPVRLDCMRVSSYKDETSPVSDPELIDTLRLDITARQVLLIDDILDTGKTLARVRKLLLDRKPASLKVCALLEKKARRKVVLQAEYVGFQIPDEFVVGYGLDFAERYRNLSCIGILKPELQNPPEWR